MNRSVNIINGSDVAHRIRSFHGHRHFMDKNRSICSNDVAATKYSSALLVDQELYETFMILYCKAHPSVDEWVN